MRKLINSAFISLDGVTSDPSSWAIFDPDSGEEAAHYHVTVPFYKVEYDFALKPLGK